MITQDMRALVDRQRLGFVATVNADGTPNLSPKGTVVVWDDNHLLWVDIRSPRTMRNLRERPATEINVVDPLIRKGYRFRGTCRIVTDDAELQPILRFYREERLVMNPIRAAVLVAVVSVERVTSPSYDEPDADEAEIRQRYIAWYTADSVEDVEQP
ncbi:MAG: pyridoxamine 5'-phosphate oxidase family protein [Chloroflexota bacterium]|jgi:predicted pyridoxine 5'-phosphate oxidase superfamily flavin-nucleotide-binding protein|nr:pyridoxamine 5'-phosphate oxidase family protein [Chloroflexota bacterium]